MPKTLGEFEQLILYALLSLEGDAYGASIRRAIVERAGREVSAGAVYTVLERLETAGLVSSSVGEPTAQRGGRRRKYYALRPDGARLLRESRQRMARMSEGLEAALDDLAAEGSA